MSYIPCAGGCAMASEHRENCNGRDRRGGECGGCLPRPASRGMLCESCWLRLVDVTENLVDIVTHTRSLTTGGGARDSEGRSSATLGYWTLAPGPIAADEIYATLAELVRVDADADDEPHVFGDRIVQGFMPEATIEQVAAETQGMLDLVVPRLEEAVLVWKVARAAVKLVRKVQHVERSFPMHEDDHRVPFVRCRECQRIRLTWRPPRYQLDEVRIQCEHCGHVESQDMIEFDIKLIANERKNRK